MRIARTIADFVNDKPIPKSPVKIAIPIEDDRQPSDGAHLGNAEGQTFAIEYVDSRNQSSTRRITVWSIIAGVGGVPSLVAFCHERNASRQFRIDRIKCFVDFDGEVFDDVPEFLSQNFGMNLLAATRTSTIQDQRWPTILDAVRHNAVILSALSRSDGKTVQEEIEIATNHLSRLAEANGLMLDESEILAIYRYANRLRPTEAAIGRAIEEIAKLGHRHVEKLLLAAIALVDADGQRHPQEVALINDISRDLIGVEIA